MEKLLVIYPQKRGNIGRERLDRVLKYALDGMDVEVYEDMDVLWDAGDAAHVSSGGACPTTRFRGRRVLFVVPLGTDGVNRGYYEVLAWLRTGDQVLEGSVAGLLGDADSVDEVEKELLEEEATRFQGE